MMVSGSCFAQYRCEILQPNGFNSSEATATLGNFAIGSLTQVSTTGVLWHGNRHEYTSLGASIPTGIVDGAICATESVSGVFGTPRLLLIKNLASPLNLARGSYALAGTTGIAGPSSGLDQAYRISGWANLRSDTPSFPVIWRSPVSFDGWSTTEPAIQSLLPLNFDGGMAHAVEGDFVVGYLTRSSSARATVWQRSGNLYTFKFHSIESSEVFHTSQGWHVGKGYFDRYHALLWKGLENGKSIHPPFYGESSANGNFGRDTIVGAAKLFSPSYERAVVWLGPNQELLDLHSTTQAFGFEVTTSVASHVNESGIITGYLVPNGTSSRVACRWVPTAMVRGRVELRHLADPSRAANYRLAYTMRRPGSSEAIQRGEVPLDPYGGFAIPSPHFGEATVTLRAGHWLGKAVVSEEVRQATLGTVPLQNGDCDQDNMVTTMDYLIINAAFDTTAGDPGFDPRADLDEDGSITTNDYLIFNEAFGLDGDQ